MGTLFEVDPAFPRDPAHWLYRLTPSEWLRASLGELSRAEAALKARDRTRGIAGLKRAAGMSLNAALIITPNERWGQSYLAHLAAAAEDETVPEPARSAARLLLELKPPSGSIVNLSTRSEDERWLEATRTVMAHAYAIVHGEKGRAARARME